MRKRRADFPRGIVAGLAGGLVASWAMNRFQSAWNAIASGRQEEKGEPQDDTTVRAASAVSEGIFGHRLSEREKRVAGPAVHYSFGTLVGGLYGAAAEKDPRITTGAGLPFGAAFWLVADESAVPLLKLAEPPGRYPVRVHVYALVSHLVFGGVTELVRRWVRRLL